MKMPNGYGTVYKLSGNRRKPYIARITTGFEIVINKKTEKEVSKQLYKTIGYFEDKPSAIDALAKHRFQPVVPKANITLKELYEEWSKNKYEDEISKQTIGSYSAGWKHLSKYGNIKFKELRTSHLQSIVNDCRKEGMSRSTLQKIKIVANMLYNYAIENDMTNKNYAKFIKIKKEGPEEKEIFNDIEIKKITDAAGTTEWADTILILIYTGMRISELLELTIFNIDLEKQIITGGIKTDAGKNRTIPINPKIYSYIKKWYETGGTRLICDTNKIGLSARKYREDYYRPALEKIGVRTLEPHSCRHTLASMLSKAGANTKSIQDIMGHSDYALTANIYTHKDLEELKKAMNMI